MMARPFTLVGVWCLLTVPVRADAVSTADGSRLVGSIEVMTAGKLVINTKVAGRLEIQASEITAVQCDHPVNVEFASGDRLVGTIEVPVGQDSSVMRTALGDLPVDASRITSIWPQGQESPTVLAIRRDAAQSIEAARPKWSATLEAGGLFTEGNTNRLEGHGRFDLRRKTNDDLLEFYLAGEYSEQNKRRTENEYKGGIGYEQMLTSRWFWYTDLALEHDEFENLDLRTVATIGAGYYVIKRDDHELKPRAGFGYRHESFDDDSASDEAVIDLGLDYRLDLAPWFRFTHATTFNPDFEDFDDYRLNVDNAAQIPLTDDSLSLKLGVRHEYNSRPQTGVDRLDTTYYANLVFKLK